MPMRNHLSRLTAAFGATSKRTDAFICHLSRMLSTAQGIEASLCTVFFTLNLVHSQLVRLLTRQYERLALTVAFRASQTMIPASGGTVVTAIEPLEAPQTRLSQICTGAKNLAEVFGELGILMRLWGLLHIYKWARETYSQPPRDAIIKILVWAQIGTFSIFHVIEHAAYLAGKGVLQGEKWEQRSSRWTALCNRFWLAKVLLECLRLLRVRQLKWNEDFGAESEDEKKVTVQSEALKKQWQRDVYANAAWLPVTLRWSYEDESNSPIDEAWQSLCGLVPGIIRVQEAWETSA